MTLCSYANCGRPAASRGLCRGHLRQQHRGLPLTTLRGPRGQLGAETLVPLPGVRVSPPCADELRAVPGSLSATVRGILERWAGRKRAPCAR